MLVSAALAFAAAMLATASARTFGRSSACYSNETDPYVLFATKTSYFEVDEEDASPEEDPPGCEAAAFWLIARHGTRNPGDDDILLMKLRGPVLRDEIVWLHGEGAGDLCQADVDRFVAWDFNLTVADESLLTESGKLELFEMGHRFRSRFPDILALPFDTGLYYFRHTIKERAEASAKAYAKGAFPREEVYITPPLEEDPLLRFYDFCTKWIEDIDENEATYEEQRLFRDGPEMAAVRGRVEARLGFDEIGFEDLVLMYDLCRYERAFWPRKVSTWCAVFDKEGLEVLEYYEELEYWYKNGYAFPLNYEMACPLLQDMAMTFNNDSTRIGTFYFSHSEALLPLLGLFGLYHDDRPLLHSNFAEMSGREYRTSLMGSFAGNLAVVFYKCQEEPKERISVWHQERPVDIPGCDEPRLCDWKQFQDVHKVDIACPFDAMCDAAKNSHRSTVGENGGNAMIPATILLLGAIAAQLLMSRLA